MRILDDLVFCEINKIISDAKISKEMVNIINSCWDWPKASPFQAGMFKWANLVFTTCEFISGVPENALSGGVAMEFFCKAADIYDDIQDEDNNQQPWRKLPFQQALNLATTFLLLAYKALDNIHDLYIYKNIVKVLNETGIRACDGQFYEHINDKDNEFDINKYLNIAEKKAGSLTGCASKIGAIFANSSEEIIEQLGLFGINLGVIAQIKNDAHDFFNDSKSDLVKRKKTLPFIYLNNVLNTQEKNDFEDLLKIIDNEKGKIESKVKEKIRQLISEEGVLQYCSVICEILNQDNLRILQEISLSDEKKGKMMKLVEESAII